MSTARSVVKHSQRLIVGLGISAALIGGATPAMADEGLSGTTSGMTSFFDPLGLGSFLGSLFGFPTAQAARNTGVAATQPVAAAHVPAPAAGNSVPAGSSPAGAVPAASGTASGPAGGASGGASASNRVTYPTSPQVSPAAQQLAAAPLPRRITPVRRVTSPVMETAVSPTAIPTLVDAAPEPQENEGMVVAAPVGDAALAAPVAEVSEPTAQPGGKNVPGVLLGVLALTLGASGILARNLRRRWVEGPRPAAF